MEKENSFQTRLDQSESFDNFVESIACELDRYGIKDWAYTQIDVPNQLTTLEHIGTLDQQYLDAYIENATYNSDLMLQHVKLSNTPRFQSDIEKELKSTRLEFSQKRPSINFINMNKDFGYRDVCCIPTTSPIDGVRFLLTLTSKNSIESKFKMGVMECIDQLRMASRSICESGAKRHKKSFFRIAGSYQILAKSAPMKLLETMIKHDMKVSEAATHLGISRDTAKQQLHTVRSRLNAKTNHGACLLAIKYGLID